MAARYECRHVVYHYTQKGFRPEDRGYFQAVSQANLSYLLRRADYYGVDLLVENLALPAQGEPLYTVEDFETLLSQFPSLNVLIDVAHGFITGLDLEVFLSKHGHRVKAFHLNNNDGKTDQHRQLFDGEIDYQAFAKLYQRYTPGRDIVLEYEPHVRLSKAELLEQVDWLANTFSQIK